MSSSAEEDEPDGEKGSEKLEAQDEEKEEVRVGIKKPCSLTIKLLSYHFYDSLSTASTYR